ncbi:MAG TPA: hypothetical protein PKN75_07755 [Bacteroidia bacterium]|nr:hypothetical protein [Bacteroidia bacterium]HNU33473.1 hypothetical protein [Bacteroidia bacterium]
MAIYRFKVSFEDYEDVSREIEIKSDQTFAELHHAIQSAISFDGLKQSSFYMSNDNWIKGKEICTHQKTDKAGKKVAHANDAKLSAYIVDPHQKIYYVVDGDAPWTFHIELVRILPSADLKISYPHVARKNGEAPRQYTVTVPPPGSGEDEFLELDETPTEADDDGVVEAVDESELGDDMSEEGEETAETEEGEGDENFDDVQMSGDEDDR